MSNTINADNGVVSTIPGLKYSADTSGVLILQTNTTNVLTLDTTQGATFSTGALVTNPYAGSYSSGMVLDHTTALGRISVAASAAIAFYNGGISARVETMRIDSSGNVGIGTVSPSTYSLQKLVVYGNGIASASGSGTTLAKFEIFSNGQTNNQVTLSQGFATTDNIGYLYNRANADFVFGTNNAERMRITSSGNVGIGTTSPVSSLDVQGNITIIDAAGYLNNLYYSGGWKYRGNGYGLAYVSDGTGAAVWSNAPNNVSGAGVAATITERMRIDSSGNVGIGTSSPAQKLHVSSASATYIQVQNTGNSVNAYYGVDTGGGWMGTSTNNYAAFYTNNTERMRITSTGSVIVGSTTGTTSTPNLIEAINAVGYGSTSTAGIALGGPNNGYVNNGQTAAWRLNSVISTSSQNLYFDAYVQATGWVTRASIDNSGNFSLLTSGTSILNSSGRKMLNQTGGILQVVQATLTSIFSANTNGSWLTVTGLAASITPSSTSSKILVMLDMKGGNNTATVITGRITRNGTAIYVGNTGLGFQASTAQYYFSGDTRSIGQMNATYLDSPASTSALTYQAQINGDNTGQTIWVNTDGRQSTSVDSTTASSITLMEIAG
jgi:hypothetical protein